MQKLEYFLKHIYWTRFSGELSSKQLWEGYDLEDFREYQIWDNVKKINWKLSAKYDKEYISIYRQEKEPILDIFVDINANTYFFEEKLKDILNLLSILIKNLWIKKNIYKAYYSWFFKNKFNLDKVDNFDIDLRSNKKSCIKDIVKSDIFKNNNYKIIISDFMFLEKIEFNQNIFCLLVPTINILENSKIPVLNGYFDYNLNKDLLENYKKELLKLKNYDFI